MAKFIDGIGEQVYKEFFSRYAIRHDISYEAAQETLAKLLEKPDVTNQDLKEWYQLLTDICNEVQSQMMTITVRDIPLNWGAVSVGVG